QRAAAIAKSSDPTLADYFAPINAETSKGSAELQKRVDQALTLPEERAVFERIGTARKNYLTARDAVSEAKKSGDPAAAERAYAEQFEPASKAYVAAVQALVDLQQSSLNEAAQRAEALR
ncbi:MCP four helix bundle domain-containing protein, partial [Rubrivivax gelatinosus]